MPLFSNQIHGVPSLRNLGRTPIKEEQEHDYDELDRSLLGDQ